MAAHGFSLEGKSAEYLSIAKDTSLNWNIYFNKRIDYNHRLEIENGTNTVFGLKLY